MRKTLSEIRRPLDERITRSASKPKQTETIAEKKLKIALAFICDRADGLQGEDPRDVLFVIEHMDGQLGCAECGKDFMEDYSRCVDHSPGLGQKISRSSPLRVQERFNRFPNNNADSGCAACTDLQELFVSIREPSNRQYWLITELFVKLHGGKDVCGSWILR